MADAIYIGSGGAVHRPTAGRCLLRHGAGADAINLRGLRRGSPSGKRTNQRARPTIGSSTIAMATNRTVAEATTSDGMVLLAMAAEPRPLGETR
jgi:hypothetical protein